MAITATERTEIEKLLVLMFNAAPGAEYLAEVVTLFENVGHNLQSVANALDDLPAFQTLHPNFQTAAEFAADFLTPLGLQADEFAKNFIMDKFNAGVPKGEIAYEALQALNGVTDDLPAQYVTARDILANKAAVSEYYSVTKGITNLDIGILQTVLNGVTADDATVITAEHEIDSGTRGVQGITAALTTSQDTVIGTNAADLVNGLFGGGTTDPTYTSGDSIDGGAGSDRLNLVATGTDTSPAVTVKNVESINIQDTVGAKFDALLVENNAGISFTNTIAGKTSTVINGSLGSVMGLAGKGDLFVDYAVTTGSTDTANVSLSGVGSSTTASNVNVGDANTVEAVKVATTGTNFVNLLAGTAAATVTITGDGTNTFTMGSIKAVSTIDASASTGTNVFNLGGTLGNGDTVKGGTGADTVSFNATTAIGGITLIGVETLKGDIDADVAINLTNSTGLKTLTLAGGTGSVDVTNATSELTTVNYQSVGGTYSGGSGIFASGGSGDFDNDFSLTYKTGQVGNIVLNLGSATATQAIHMSDISFTRAESLVVNALGTKAITVAGGIDFDASTKSIALNVADSGTLEVVGLNGGNTNVLGTLAATVGADAFLSTGSVYAGGAADLAVTLTVGASGSGDIGYVSAGSFGDITVNVGAHGTGSLSYAIADDGGFGNLTATVGSGGSGYIYADTSGGSDTTIGDVTLTLASGATGTVYAYSNSGDIGNVTETVGANTSGYIGLGAYGTADASGAYAAGGNIGDLTLNVTGSNATGDISAYASGQYSGGNGTGGNIGNVTLNVTGSGATGYISGYTSGGSQGDFTITVGNSGYAYVSSFAGEIDSGGDNGNIGNINIGLADGAYFSGYWDASGSVGTTNVEAGDDVSAYVDAYGNSGDVGAVTVSMGDNAFFSGWFSAYSGTVGAASVTVGEGSYVDVGLSTESGSLGAIDVTAGVGSYVEVWSDGYAPGNTHAEAMTVAGGEAGDMAYGYASGGSIDGIDFHGWLGHYYIDASYVTAGVTIQGGADGGTIYGSSTGGDIITGGAGNDYINAYDGSNVVDGGAGNDTLIGGSGSDVLGGGAGNDSINGGAGTDAIDGGAGNDTINGEDGNDNILGGDGNDVITGGAGVDAIDGGAGNDIIQGNAGVDNLTGGAGSDTFVFTGDNLSVVAESAPTSIVVTDVIADFVKASDSLAFAESGATGGYAEVLTAVADFATLRGLAITAIDGTSIDYYFGVVGTDGYLFHGDGTSIDAVVKLTGVTDIDVGNIVAAV